MPPAQWFGAGRDNVLAGPQGAKASGPGRSVRAKRQAAFVARLPVTDEPQPIRSQVREERLREPGLIHVDDDGARELRIPAHYKLIGEKLGLFHEFRRATLANF